MLMPGRHYSNGDLNYRYGFGGQEVDNEIHGNGNSIAYMERMYDPRLGRWKSLDPLFAEYTSHSPYCYAFNNPIHNLDQEGASVAGAIMSWLMNRMGLGNSKKAHKTVEAMTLLNDTQKNAVLFFAGAAKSGYSLNALTATKAIIWDMNPFVMWYNMYDAYDEFSDGEISADEAISKIPIYGGMYATYLQFVSGYDNATSDKVDWYQAGQDFALTVQTVGSFAEGFKQFKKNFNIKNYFKKTAKGGSSNKAPAPCFIAGTKVLTKDGPKNIEEVQKGELVWSFDTINGGVSLKKVNVVVERHTDKLTIVIVSGDTIFTTPEHPFYVSDNWLKAKDLKHGTILNLFDGNTLTVVKSYSLDTSVTVYNFEVNDYHNYFVGEKSILVHNNKCAQGGGGIRKITRGKWGKKNTYGGRKQTAIEHIEEGHFHNSRPGKATSRFSQKNSNSSSVKNLVNEAVSKGNHSGTGGNYKVNYTFDNKIGTTSSGRSTSKIIVYLDGEGNVINAYPVK